MNVIPASTHPTNGALLERRFFVRPNQRKHEQNFMNKKYVAVLIVCAWCDVVKNSFSFIKF